MPEPPAIREATLGDIAVIRALADRIWRACYPGIITLGQIDHMLSRMYDADRIRDEMQSRQIRYLLVAPSQEDEAIGFAAYGPGDRPGEMLLHKLYIDPARQRLGLGSALLGEVIRRSASAGAASLSLRVNRRNLQAVRAYEKNGFAITAEDCADIGGGYVMDDFIMSRPINAPAS